MKEKMITQLVQKYRKGTINNVETKDLFSIFKRREPSAMNGKRKDGAWITDLRRKDTVISKIWSHGIGYAKSFIYKTSRQKLVVECKSCGYLNTYHALKCSKCKTSVESDKKTYHKEANVNSLISSNIDESKKFDLINKETAHDYTRVEHKHDLSVFVDRLKLDLKKRNLKNYLRIIDLLMDKKVLDSNNYLKEVGSTLNVSPQAINVKIKKMKEIVNMGGYKTSM